MPAVFLHLTSQSPACASLGPRTAMLSQEKAHGTPRETAKKVAPYQRSSTNARTQQGTHLYRPGSHTMPKRLISGWSCYVPASSFPSCPTANSPSLVVSFVGSKNCERLNCLTLRPLRWSSAPDPRCRAAASRNSPGNGQGSRRWSASTAGLCSLNQKPMRLSDSQPENALVLPRKPLVDTSSFGAAVTHCLGRKQVP